MTRIFLTVVLLCVCFTDQAQQWIRYYGYGQQPYDTYCLEHYDKGYLLSGSINNTKYGWLIKTDINGNQLWDVKIGDGINSTSIQNVEITKDQGLVLCGSTSIIKHPNFDPYIMKLNSCGDAEWCKILEYDNTTDWGFSVKTTSDGGYILLGQFLGNDPNDRFRIFKFDSLGEILWYKIYNRDSLIYSENIGSLYSDSLNFLITGMCYYPNWVKPYYIQTDTAGNEIWRLVYSQHTGLGYIGDASVSIRDRFGNYYSAGRRESFAELLKFSGTGMEISTVDLIPGTEAGNSTTIHMQNDSTLIINASWTFNGSTSFLAILKTDTLGNIIVQKNLPDPYNSGIRWTTKTSDNKILAFGSNYISANSRLVLFKFNSNLEYDSVYTRHFTYDSLCPNAIISHIIVPNCDVITGLNEPIENPETSKLNIFPNPADQKITVEFPKFLVVKNGNKELGSTTVYHKWKSTTLEIYDFSGKMVFQTEILQAQTSLQLDVSGWQRGLYYFRLNFNKQTIDGEKVIME